VIDLTRLTGAINGLTGSPPACEPGHPDDPKRGRQHVRAIGCRASKVL
jgi:hypothetical protein